VPRSRVRRPRSPPSGTGEPSWWYGATLTDRLIAGALTPAAAVYGAIVRHRLTTTKPYASRHPVICVGNFTAGGTGKTPTVRHIAQLVRDAGRTPVFLSRGYKGREAGPVWVDPDRHTARDVGDEPLLLASDAATVVSRDRADGARLIESEGNAAYVIIMDDGMQNPGLAKDITIAIIDAGRGLGNALVIPAGPLRAPARAQATLADLILINGTPVTRSAPAIKAIQELNFDGPICDIGVQPAPSALALKDRAVVAFAGIANPHRFYHLLAVIGADVRETISFTDHHAFTAEDAARLIGLATGLGAQLVTTAKDFVRLTGEPSLDHLAERTRVVDITLRPSPVAEEQIAALLKDAMFPK